LIIAALYRVRRSTDCHSLGNFLCKSIIYKSHFLA